MRRTPFYFSLAATLPGVAACAGDRGPTAPPSLDDLSLQIADEPVSHLVIVNALSYAAGSGVTARLGVNEGLLTAARTGGQDFRVRLQLTASNDLGQTRGISPKADPLALLKTVADFGSFELADVLVPWDGLDGNGQPMTGEVTIEYRITLEFRPNPTGDGIVVGGALTGSTRLVVIA
jgi:hypothetical protein